MFLSFKSAILILAKGLKGVSYANLRLLFQIYPDGDENIQIYLRFLAIFARFLQQGQSFKHFYTHETHQSSLTDGGHADRLDIMHARRAVVSSWSGVADAPVISLKLWSHTYEVGVRQAKPSNGDQCRP